MQKIVAITSAVLFGTTLGQSDYVNEYLKEQAMGSASSEAEAAANKNGKYACYLYDSETFFDLRALANNKTDYKITTIDTDGTIEYIYNFCQYTK